MKEFRIFMTAWSQRSSEKDDAIAVAFKSKYKDFAYIERKTSDSIRNKLIAETKVWAQANNTKRIVNPIFRLLGAESLVLKYQEIKESQYKKPNATEKARADILYRVVKSIIPLVLMDEMPEILIDESKRGAFKPLQFAEKNYVKVKGERNKKYKIHKLAFRHEDFSDDAYMESLMKMAEALLHVYGKSRSSTMTMFLTHLGEWILDGAKVIRGCENEWNVVKH